MGKIITPTYRVEYRSNSCDRRNPDGRRSMCWSGRATQARLEQWRRDYNQSFNLGGVNFHISEAQGFVEHISSARIVRQSTGEVVAETTMPAFEVE